jgi:zinc transport system substrate-binding protein
MKRILPFIFLLTACGQKAPVSTPEAKNTGKPVIYTTFYPTQYFTQRITGDFADVICPVPADEDPIFWNPDSVMIAKYQQADLVILNGAGFEKWVNTVNLPQSRIVDSAKSFEAEFITYENAVQHQHGEKGAHTHEGTDGHTWVDPINAITQSKAILDALNKKYPDKKERFDANFASLKSDLQELDTGFKEISNKTPLLASHPAYNYIARRYGWNIKNLDLDPDDPPARLNDNFSKIILWESTPTKEIPSFLNSTFSPCEHAPPSGDYLSIMKTNLDTMR